MIAKFRHWTGWIEGRKKKRKGGKKWHEHSQKRGREREREREREGEDQGRLKAWKKMSESYRRLKGGKKRLD